MPRLFLVSLVRVCTRVRTPRFVRRCRNPFNLRAFCVAQRGEMARCNPLVSIASNANWVNVLSRTTVRLKSFLCKLNTVTSSFQKKNNFLHIHLLLLHKNKARQKILFIALNS